MKMGFGKLILVMLLATTTACTTTVRSRTGFEQNLQHKEQIAMLPPEVAVNTVELSGKKERMYNYEYHIEDLLIKYSPEVLKEKGYNVKALSKREAKDLGIGEDIYRFRNRYSENVIAGLYRADFMNKKTALATDVNLGKNVETLGKTTQSDVILVLDYNQNVMTNGNRAFAVAVDVLVGSSMGARADSASLVAALVDANDGNLLWSNKFYVNEDVIFSPIANSMKSDEEIDIKKVSDLLKYTFRELPNRKELGAKEAKKL